MIKENDIACFSYLAAAQIFQIDEYPKRNDGAEINRIIPSLAADGSIVAVTAARLGVHTQLLTNNIGIDHEAERIYSYLEKNGVATNIQRTDAVTTPTIVILSDLDGNREWFSYIREAQESLNTLDLTSVRDSTMVYVDLYEGIADASIRVLDYVTHADIPRYINISGNIDNDSLVQSQSLRGAFIIQGSVPEEEFYSVEEKIKTLYKRTEPTTIIVTAGRKGAVAYTGADYVRAYAYQIEPLQVHAAGAAFTSGIMYGLTKNWSLEASLQFACAVGSWNCTQERGFETITIRYNRTIYGKY